MTTSLSSPDYMAVSGAITRLNAELNYLVQGYATELDKCKTHKGKIYRRHVQDFAKSINKLEEKFNAPIFSVAAQISKLQGKGWQENAPILTLWQQVAHTVALVSEHPTKKNAALLLNDDNRLLAFSANRVPPGIKKQGKHYEKGLRKDFITCAERLTIGKHLGVKLHPVPQVKRLTGSQYERLVRQSVRNFSDDVVRYAQMNQGKERETLLTLATPCDTCFPSITALNPKLVFADSRLGINYTRDVGFERVRNNLAGYGISLLDLAV